MAADDEFRKAQALLRQGEVEPAIAAYETALRHDPDHAETLIFFGALLK